MERQMKKALFLIPFLVWAGFLKAQPLVVLLSKSYGNQTYEQWLLREVPGIRLVSMYHCPKDSLAYWIERADGIVLTGGEDIFPGRYGKAADTIRCGAMDLRRDSLEFRLLDEAHRRKLPLFGVCRGLQLINVYRGGSLWTDIPEQIGEKIIHMKEGDARHAVAIKPGSLLETWSGRGEDSVRSNHHQGIELLGSNLEPEAFTADGLTEAIRGKAGTAMPFVYAVQWHPERMQPGHRLSAPLARAFLNACLKNKK
jgi:gamma-glutamyl-gamma-aminobutyrate hydrolase PuuD